jgi:hypothetical protein
MGIVLLPDLKDYWSSEWTTQSREFVFLHCAGNYTFYIFNLCPCCANFSSKTACLVTLQAFKNSCRPGWRIFSQPAVRKGLTYYTPFLCLDLFSVGGILLIKFLSLRRGTVLSDKCQPGTSRSTALECFVKSPSTN